MEKYLVNQLKRQDFFIDITLVGLALVVFGGSGAFIYGNKQYRNNVLKTLEALEKIERGEGNA